MATTNSKKEKELTYQLLTKEERIRLKRVDQIIESYESLVRKFMINQWRMKTNCLFIWGPPGVGKTYNTLKALNDSIENGEVSSLEYQSGNITGLGLYEILKQNKEAGMVTLLDDCDVLAREDSYKIFKAAIDTKSDQKPRRVTKTTGLGAESYDYNGFLIMITNSDYSRTKNIHIKACLRRVHLVELNLNKTDILIKSLSILEKYINSEDFFLTEERDMLDFLSVFPELKEMYTTGTFDDAEQELSVSFIEQIAELYLIGGPDWRDISVPYKRLKEMYEFKKKNEILSYIKVPYIEDQNTSIDEAIEMKWKEVNGQWYKPLEL